MDIGPKRVLVSSKRRNVSKDPEINKYDLNLGEPLRNISSIRLRSASVPNSLNTINKYNRSIQLDTSGGSYLLLLATGEYTSAKVLGNIGKFTYSNLSANFYSIADAFNQATTNSALMEGCAGTINNISDTFNISGTQAGVYAIGDASTDIEFSNLFVSNFNTLTNQLEFTLNPPVNSEPTVIDQIGSVSILDNSSFVKAFSVNDIFGFPKRLNITYDNPTLYSSMNTVNLFPSTDLLLKINDGNGNYFENVEILNSTTNTMAYGESVNRGERFFASIALDEPFGSIVYYHPHSEHYAYYDFVGTKENMSKIGIEWFNMRNDKAIPVDFLGNDHNILIDIYHNKNRNINRY